MMRSLMTFLAVLSLACSTVVNAAGASVPEGTWKLRSQRSVTGTPPSFSPGLVMTVDGAGKTVVRLNGSVPATVVAHDRMKFTTSKDGRVLTQEAKGLDEKTGKLYEYVLTWDKQ